MRYIFSPQGEMTMHRFIGPDTLLAFDFDGTLAPIVPHPDAAGTPTSISRAMQRLCDVASVAVITGRSVADIRGRLGFNPRYIVGNHGAEGLPGHKDADRRPEVAMWETQLRETPDGLPPGTNLENKGHSLTLHYRMAANRDLARATLEARIRTLSPAPRSIGGKCVINLLPADAADKFDALLALQRNAGAPNALFVGDDDTDETVFRNALPDWLTIRIGQDKPSAAAFCLNSQQEMASLIVKIDTLVRNKPRKDTR